MPPHGFVTRHIVSVQLLFVRYVSMSTNTRISVGNGKYCYTGPTCKLHGKAQTDIALTSLMAAYNNVEEATTADEMMKAKQELESARFAYDVTSEGTNILKDALNDAEGFEKLELQVRLHKAEEFAKQFEDKYEKESNLKPTKTDLVDVTLSDNHTYKVPTMTENDRGYEVGSKAPEGHMDIQDVKKNVVKDINEAIRAGYLPKDLKYRVTTSRFRGGQSLRVSIQNTKDSQMEEEVPLGQWGGTQQIPTELARNLKNRVGIIAEAYNVRESFNSMSDYPFRRYYAHTEIETEGQRRNRLDTAAKAKRKRDQKPNRDAFVNKVRENPKKAADSVPFYREIPANGKNYQVGRVPNSNIYVVKNTLSSGSTFLRAYDMSSSADNVQSAIEYEAVQGVNKTWGEPDLLKKMSRIF